MRHLAVVFLAVDGAAVAILFPVQVLTLSCSYHPICFRGASVMAQPRLPMLKMTGFAGRKLTAAHTILNAVLLARLPVIDTRRSLRE